MTGGVLNLGSNQLSVEGNTTFTGGNLQLDIVSAAIYGKTILSGAAGNIDLGSGVTSLAINTAGYSTPSYSDKFFIMVNNGGGTTNGYFFALPQAATVFTAGGNDYKIYYGGNFATNSITGGNDVVIAGVRPAVPEPGTLLLISGMCSVWLLRRPRKSRRTESPSAADQFPGI